ncbi:hypothetical protein BMS3Bbin04_02118 [bacterium BMS3Bbin04]|nr:hypothetical protein BMS3Bbin04_02118 [bacterium BMS3Bbin04]
MTFAELNHLIIYILYFVDQVLLDLAGINFIYCVRMLTDDPHHRTAILLESLERTTHTRQFSGGTVRFAMHKCSNTSCVRTALIAVVRHPLAHQQRTQVGIAKAQRTELMAVFLDLT